MDSPENRNLISRILNEVGDYYEANPASILTESDLKCEIYRRLRETDEFGLSRPTANPRILGHAIHTEVKFFDRNGHLTQAPDLALFNPTNISILNNLDNRAALPSKGFHATGKPIVIELKFIRSRGTINSKLGEIRDDYTKWINDFTIDQDFHLFLFVISKFHEHGEVLERALPIHIDPRVTYIHRTAGILVG